MAEEKKAKTKTVTIKAPNIQRATFDITGTAPLVVHRFSAKTKIEMREKMETGKPASNKKNRDAKDTDELYHEAMYKSPEGWEGFNAAGIRKAMVSACRLVNFKMTLAKLSIFVEPDGYDEKEPQVPLIRIYGKSVKQEDMGRVSNGQPYVIIRPAYHNWKAKLKIMFDADQFTVSDISNLLTRVGLQVGICEGRHDSKNSTGMGWGLFSVS